MTMRGMASLSVFAMALLIAFGARAGLASFSVRVQDDLRVADVEVVDVGGESYVSLASLVNQMGGGCRITPERVQVDLAAKAAWMALNAPGVSSSMGTFNLAHPLQEKGGDALIALNDVMPLFQKAFNLAIKRDLPVPPVPAAESPAIQDAVPPAESIPATPPIPSEPAVPDSNSPPAASEPPAATTQPVAAEPTSVTVPAAPAPAVPESGHQPGAAEPSAATEPARAANRPIQIVILDPGHGGADAGCEGQGGLKESVIVLNIAAKVRAALEQSGIKVLLSREKDQEMARNERVAFANKNKGDLYIAIHLGGGLSQTGHGVEAFTWDAERGAAAAEGQAKTRPGKDYAAASITVAKIVADSVAAASGQDVRGVHQAPCAILGDIGMPGVAVETGYISNPAEESLLLTDEHQGKIAAGLAEAVKKLASDAGGNKP